MVVVYREFNFRVCRQEATSQTAGQVATLQEKIVRLKVRELSPHTLLHATHRFFFSIKAFLKIATSRIMEKTTVPANLEGRSSPYPTYMFCLVCISHSNLRGFFLECVRGPPRHDVTQCGNYC